MGHASFTTASLPVGTTAVFAVYSGYTYRIPGHGHDQPGGQQCRGTDLTSLSPTSGTTAGGTTVTIIGTKFTGATAVTFGSTPATNVTVVNSTKITAKTPARTGTVDVRVTTPGGTTTISSADHYTFVAPK